MSSAFDDEVWPERSALAREVAGAPQRSFSVFALGANRPKLATKEITDKNGNKTVVPVRWTSCEGGSRWFPSPYFPP